MEVLMKEGAQVEEQIAKSDEVMQQVHQAVSRFEPFAIICRKLFVLLGALRDISFLYEFSSTTFMHILGDVLDKNKRSGTEDEAQRISSLKTALFNEVAARVARGLKADDKIVFSILLARLYVGDESIGSNEALSSDEYVEQISVLGENFPWQGRGLNELEAVTELEIGATVPLLLCSAPGHDVSGRVEAMARDLKKDFAAVAMGSAEGYDTAESLVTAAAKRGTWVMLKNCHLCTAWLHETFVKKLQSLGHNTHRDFRLFMTSEISPKLPTALLRLSDLIVAEAPTGIQASMARFFSSISKNRFENPVRNRLYLILAWTHAVIQERLRYVPSGWSEKYEFTEADATHALDVIDALIKDMGGDKEVLDPEKLPWDAIRSTLRQGVFGGRVTQPVDQDVLDKLVNTLFVSDSFNLNFKLVPDVVDAPTLPEGTSKDECVAWISSLSRNTPPTWVGLGSDAETELEIRKAKSIKEKIDRVAVKEDHD
jgi:dynein heavy chain 1